MFDEPLFWIFWMIWPALGAAVTGRRGQPLYGFFWGLPGPIGFIVAVYLRPVQEREPDPERTSSSWVRCDNCGMPMRGNAPRCGRCDEEPS